jgi:hypothetical protein
MDAVSVIQSAAFLQASAKIQGTPAPQQVQLQVQQAPEPPKPPVEAVGQTSADNGAGTQTGQNGTRPSNNAVDLTV